MANLRRHFNFSGKPSTMGPNENSPISSVTFDKHSLMSNICSCLDICSSYIQALNSLCATGSLLARNLLQTVQNVPAYQNVAQQFLCIWDEVGKATAGASAAVKTETLMMLQEVLNTLEMGSNDNAVDASSINNFQVIGSCLYSLIELQAQFSMSTWKSLSKLSKNFSNDAFIHSLHWKSHERNPLKVVKNSELSSTIKKHYSHLLHKYETQKSCEQVDVPQSQFYVLPSALSNSQHVANSQCGLQTECVNSTAKTVVWSPGTTLWSTASDNEKSVISQSASPQRTRIPVASTSSVGNNELDEVINLLSCMPLNQFQSSIPQSSPNQGAYNASSLLRSYQFWPEGSGPVLSRHQRPWSDGAQDINFGFDSWIWRSDNMNCSALPNGKFNGTEDKISHKNSWSNMEFQRWSAGTGENGSSSDDTSSTQGQDMDLFPMGVHSLAQNSIISSTRVRKFSSTDGLPANPECIPEAENECLNIQMHKMSTWPLKQSRLLTEPDWSEELESKCMPLYYIPNS